MCWSSAESRSTFSSRVTFLEAAAAAAARCALSRAAFLDLSSRRVFSPGGSVSSAL